MALDARKVIVYCCNPSSLYAKKERYKVRQIVDIDICAVLYLPEIALSKYESEV